tara:strand:- start:95 stop:211 length:117 start_codon:yes stop_codon:yes gene_type:complete
MAAAIKEDTVVSYPSFDQGKGNTETGGNEINNPKSKVG